MSEQNILANALEGIKLARSGHKVEALSYLRESVQREPVNAEVWLWLAHVTSDVREYQNCVYQALSLEPHHVIARQMQDALIQRQYSTGAQPQTNAYRPQIPDFASAQMNPEVLARAQKRTNRRRFMVRLLGIAIAGSVIGGILAVVALVVADSPFF